MVKPFFTDHELSHLRTLALSGLTLTVTITRRTTADTVYGDDEEVTFPVVGTAQGWLYSTPTPVQRADTGSVITVNTYRMFVPVGTDILPGDRVTCSKGTFVVSDTTGESTWLAMMACSLRKRE